MQLHRFTNGGFVIHQIRLPGMVTRISAWFDAAGILLDCESIDSRYRSRKVHASRLHEIQVIGNRYKHTPTLSYN